MGRLAVDIGGTFTDLVHFDEGSGNLEAEKSLSTPRDLTQGVLDTINLSGIEPGSVSFFVHGGTTVINAITERKGVRTALVTTRGLSRRSGDRAGQSPGHVQPAVPEAGRLRAAPAAFRGARTDRRRGPRDRAAPTGRPRSGGRAVPPASCRGDRGPVPCTATSRRSTRRNARPSCANGCRMWRSPRRTRSRENGASTSAATRPF